MNGAAPRQAANGPTATPGRLALGLALAAAALSLRGLLEQVPLHRWPMATGGSGGSELALWVVYYSYLPRLCVSMLAGAALALAAAIFQLVLRNPLAEPGTLGVSAGASLALAVSALWLPDLPGLEREGVAMLGAAAATILVFGLAWRHQLAPQSLILAGLVVGLSIGSLGATLALFNHEALRSVFLWNAGALRQSDWSAVAYLSPRLALGFGLAFAIARPLAILSLGDESGRSLGLSRRSMRLLALALAVALSAFVVSAVGVIGFVGLAAPAIARLSGARSVRQQLFWAPVVGGLLLWLTDQLVQVLPFARDVPAGIGTAILGAPLLLWMQLALKAAAVVPRAVASAPERRHSRPWLLVAAIALALLLVLWPALDLGQGVDGWRWWSRDELWRYGHWRWPRVAAAAAAGAMLGVAGGLMQRLTANAMASPEGLGMSSGAACGVILLALLVPTPDRAQQTAAAAVGALLTLAALLAMGRRAAFDPERMLLAGVAVSTAFGGLVALLTASGDPRMSMLLAWLAGSTYQVTAWDAAAAGIAAAVVLPLLPLFARWLAILPLGGAQSRALGLGPTASRLQLLAVTGVLTGAATLIVGPLSFVGLMAPHMARTMGLLRPMPHLYAGAVIGALVMVCADWLGRNILFPYQIPAGLLAAFVGAPYVLLSMARRAR